MRTGVLSIAMRSQSTLSSLQLVSPNSRQRLQASPSLSGLSWEPPVIERPRVHAPVGRQQALRDLALNVIGEGSACNEVSDLSIDVPLPRLNQDVEGSPHQADLLRDALALRRGLLTNKRAEVLVMGRVTHGRSPSIVSVLSDSQLTSVRACNMILK